MSPLCALVGTYTNSRTEGGTREYRMKPVGCSSGVVCRRIWGNFLSGKDLLLMAGLYRVPWVLFDQWDRAPDDRQR